ncbi:PTS sugar transporter subunit IIA [Garciella nitratireducens]|uniref:PTS sugar transporter subunit IIA n=1 Tax=Garciella nitratireducens TaxID=218205 RepID=UPI000DE95FA8|nr:PTS mannose transporter subunit IIAB [Garciella nitratireducens]RBP46983.1 PTS system mannose-specific IIA component [Garciella nitratireducens]
MSKTAVLIITHGNFGVELIKSVEMIMGEQEDAKALGIKLGESIEDLKRETEKIILKNQEEGKDTLIFVDILGGSPSNISLYMLKKYENIKLITGVNMIMLIETFQSRDFEKIDMLVEKILNSAIEGMKEIKF